MMVIQNLLLFSVMPGAEELVFKHVSGNVNSDGQYFRLAKNAKISFETYFNLFPVGKFLKYTAMRNVRFRIKGNGGIKIILHERSIREEKIIEEKDIDLSTEKDFLELFIESDLSEETYCFFDIQALTDEVEIQCGYWETNDLPIRSVHLAVGICTYKREEYVRQNVRSLYEYTLAKIQQNEENSVSFLISDNGGTLEQFDDCTSVFVFRNKNLGGSGGFTRCMMEALKCNRFTHMLLQDDDIVIEPEVLFRTFVFLRFVKPEYSDISLSGSMFLIESPTVQYEAGALWEGHPVSVKSKIGMTTADNLLENGKNQTIDYGAWWYNCFPIEKLKNVLPLPFFIKCDDVEFGLQLKNRTITLNGIGVWHENFDKKFNASLEYYASRNALFTDALHSEKYSLRKGIVLEAKLFFRWLLKQNYNAALFRERALSDFKKGIPWLWEIDAERLNEELRRENQLWMNKNGISEKELNKYDIDEIHDTYEKDNLRSAWPVFRYYLIPGAFSKKTPTAVQPIIHSKLEMYAGRRYSIQFNRYTRTGYRTEASKKKFWKYMIIYFFKAIPVWLFAEKYQKKYRDDSRRTMEQWKEYLGLNG